MFSLFPLSKMVDNRDSKSLIVEWGNWLLYWIEAQRKASISSRFFIQSHKYCKGSNKKKITMLTTNSELQFYDHWRKLQMCACYQSGKTLFLSEEETWTFPNAKSDTDHEPPGREVELKYIEKRKIMHHLQSHWNICKENWCKLKEMYCRIQTNVSSDVSFRGICPSKIPPSYFHVYMTSKKVRTVKIIICCYS